MPRLMLGTNKDPEQMVALDRVKESTRARFRLPESAVIMVSEITCTVPGCPPLETVVVFWTQDQTRHHFKVFKRAKEIVDDDLPFSWMQKALAASLDDAGCC